MSKALENVAKLRGDVGLRIAIVGDSMSTTNALIGHSVTSMLEQQLSHMGVPCKTYACNRDGHTYYRANTVAYIGG
jgi:hypothetical protein